MDGLESFEVFVGPGSAFEKPYRPERQWHRWFP
jgi:hypothetical protein